MSFRAKSIIFSPFFAALLLLVFCLTACGNFGNKSTDKHSKTDFVLDTVVTVTVYDYEDAGVIDECLQKCREYEKIFSRTDPESELYKLNESGSANVSDELLWVLNRAIEYCRISGGRFDITMGGISELYGFASENPAVPSPSVLSEALEHVGWENIVIEGSTVTITDPDTVIDLGAIAKGYIADSLRSFLADRGVEHAIIDLGGNILCLGAKPDGSDFVVGIQYPVKDSTNTIANVSISNMSVVTSGVYQRFFQENGEIYHHLLDPATGVSIRNDLISVSIIAENSLDCDALSTVCFAMGLDKGLALINSMENVYAVFITEDMGLHYSEGFEQRFCR